ncbi:MAG: TIGR00730 family Rossman fold protein [Phycisphaerae bacterium]|nr:TIGR00730 family Rossman fold protein [Phycisphaerae bacterium]
MTSGTPEEAWGKRSLPSDEIRFLEGPQSRRFEFFWTLRVAFEFIKGFRALHFVGPCVTVFGSARFDEKHPYYAMTREVGGRLADAGFTVLTGGGPGIMEAANRGAKDLGGRSVGCNIVLPKEQKPNAYLDRWVEFRYFFVRKVMLVKYSYAFVVMPGGFGTLDEVFETLVLIQTGKIENFPIVLMGRAFWDEMITFVTGTMLREGTISREDFEHVLITDSPKEAIDHIKQITMSRFGLKYGQRMKRSRFLGENAMA